MSLFPSVGSTSPAGSGRPTLRRAATVLGATALAAGAVLATQAGTASAADTFALNATQTITRSSAVPDFSGYWLGELTGTWSSPVSVGLEDVPGVGDIPSGTLAPGSNTNTINVGGNFNFAMPAPGSYTVEAYATDGTTTVTSPITLVVK